MRRERETSWRPSNGIFTLHPAAASLPPHAYSPFLGALAHREPLLDFRNYFASLADPRVVNRSTHLLLDIIGIAICAVICRAQSWEQVATYAKDHVDFLRTLFALPNGIPSHDTFNRVFRYLDADAFGRCFADWLNALSAKLHLEPARWHAAIDGKTLRHSFDHGSPGARIAFVDRLGERQRVYLGADGSGGQVKRDYRNP